MDFLAKNLNDQFLKRMVIFIIGTAFISFGITLTYKAQKLGTGAFDALNMGLSKTFGLEPGNWVMMIGILIILLNAFLEKRFPRILSVIPVFLIGQFLNSWMSLLNDFHPIGYPQLILILAIGVIILAFGIALYILPSFPPAPIDLITLTLTKKFNWTFRKAKTYVELSALILALIFGGPIWIGTIVITLVIGPIIQYFLKILEKPYQRFLNPKPVKKLKHV